MRSVFAFFRNLQDKCRKNEFLDAWLPCLLLSFILTLAVSSLGLCNPLGGILFLFRNPVCFLVNLSVFHVALAFAALFPHRNFGMAVAGVLWILLGITDCIMMLVRNSPLAGNDFSVFFTGFGIALKYLKGWHILLIVLGLLLITAGFVLLFRKLPKKRSKVLPAFLHFAGTAAVMVLLVCTVRLTGIIPNYFPDMTKAYDTYGFAYCFVQSLFDRGVEKPSVYNDTSLADVAARLSSAAEQEPKKKPNIIFLQLESFWDVCELNSVSFSENPIPTFRSLCENGPSGFLTVPSIGGGTANTEFEVLTGMSLDYFGVGEYPYYTVLQDRPCESVAYALSRLGYTTHAIHNYAGSFYERNTAYANLGFDTFTPLEYMVNPTYNEIGWANDAILTEQIMNALRSTDGKDFVFTVTVQGHGQYPSEPQEKPGGITVSGLQEQTLLNQYTYYVNQLRETDAFLENLIRELTSYKEDTVLIAYGDHLPALSVSEEELKNGTLYQTKYAIWSNCGITGENMDLSSYQLTARVFELIGIHRGTLPQFHTLYKAHENYQTLLELLEYDMLYGDHQIYGGASPYMTKPMKFGIQPIRITGAVQVDRDLYITGENFTESSKVSVNGRQRPTDYLSDTLLRIRYTQHSGDTFTVTQVTDTLVCLGESEPYRPAS